MLRKLAGDGLFKKAAAALVAAPLLLPLSPSFDAEAAGLAQASNTHTVQVGAGTLPKNWLIEDIDFWAKQQAKKHKKVMIIYYGSDDKEFQDLKEGVRRTFDQDRLPVVGAVLKARGDGMATAYSPDGKSIYDLNLNGGDPMLKWTTSQAVITLYNKAYPKLTVDASLAQK